MYEEECGTDYEQQCSTTHEKQCSTSHEKKYSKELSESFAMSVSVQQPIYPAAKDGSYISGLIQLLSCNDMLKEELLIW